MYFEPPPPHHQHMATGGKGGGWKRSKPTINHGAMVKLANSSCMQQAQTMMHNMMQKRADLHQAFETVLYDMLACGIHPNGACGSAVLVWLVQGKRWDRLKEHVRFFNFRNYYAQQEGNEKIIQIPLRTMNVLMDAAGKNQDFEFMEELYMSLKLYGLQPNIITCNTILFALGRADELDNMQSFFQRMQQNDPMLPDAMTFNTVIDAYGRAGKTEKMEETYNAMLAAGYPPNVKAYNVLLSAYGKANEIEKLTNFVNKLETDGVVPNTGTYNILIGVFGKMGYIAAMEDFLQSMRDAGLTCDVFTYNSVLAVYGKVLNKEKVYATWEDMKKAKIHLGLTSYQNAIEAFARCDEIEAMNAVYTEAKEKRFVMEVWPYSAMLTAYLKEGDAESMERVMADMHKNQVQPNARCYSSMVKAQSDLRNVKQMEHYFKEFLLSSAENASIANPDIHVFTSMIKGYGVEHWAKALKTFRTMKTFRLAPDSAIYESLMECLLAAPDTADIRTIFAEIPEDLKNEQIYHVYARALRQHGSVVEADQVLQDLAVHLETVGQQKTAEASAETSAVNAPLAVNAAAIAGVQLAAAPHAAVEISESTTEAATQPGATAEAELLVSQA
uniref:Pentacotripeptide-repeat region of PRORP domain-containing protein n=1 Tax=Eutreptiella gymnastica TaxID=73025 RepID=A0A7S1IDX8_9EUGL|mmetsp:Transcript_150171/g.262363  ORF Transcript_150171/g.262363 Transcript_150171/m.262363 type:complete len:614 (+) Transcript_150171:237-2078(+)